MKDVYIQKLYDDLYKYCDGIIENALAIEEIPNGFTRDQVRRENSEELYNILLKKSQIQRQLIQMVVLNDGVPPQLYPTLMLHMI